MDFYSLRACTPFSEMYITILIYCDFFFLPPQYLAEEAGRYKE